MPDLESFEYDHLPPHLRDIGQEFHELMLFTQDHVPSGPNLEIATAKLLEARDACYKAVAQQRQEDRQAADQMALDLQDEPSIAPALRFPSWPHIQHTD